MFDDILKTLKAILAQLGGGGGSSSNFPVLPTTSSIGDGSKNVTTAGTAVTLGSSTSCKAITITARLSNTGIISVGGSTVVAASGSRRGTPLGAGDSITLEINDISLVYIDATVSGEGVTFTYIG